MAATHAVLLEDLPGHLFRRLHQLAVAQFTAEMKDGLTPIQWAALMATAQRPGLDQSTLSREIYIDTSTVAGVLDRLEVRGLIRRKASVDDRRLRLLYVTDEGETLLKNATVAVLEMQERLLDPLSPKERGLLMDLMLKLIRRLE